MLRQVTIYPDNTLESKIRAIQSKLIQELACVAVFLYKESDKKGKKHISI